MEERRPDAELLAAAAGDPEAFGAFYRRHEERILRFFRARVGRPELAADLAAETFATALLNIQRFEPTKGPAVGWLFGIAHHLLLTSLRRKRVEDRARRQLEMPPLDLTDELIERIDALDGRATAALAGLPDDQRGAIEARVLDERDYSELAQDLACSPAVVRQRVSRGLKTLRLMVEEK